MKTITESMKLPMPTMIVTILTFHNILVAFNDDIVMGIARKTLAKTVSKFKCFENFTK